jgi:hypothetical protein
MSAATLEAEARVHELARGNAGFSLLGGALPPFFAYDASGHALVTGLIDGAEDLRQYQRRDGADGANSVALARSLAVSLAQIHGGVWAAPSNSGFPGRMPWIFTFHKAPLVGGSPGNVELQQLLSRLPDYAQALDRLIAQWHINAFIHGDLKWDNVLVHHASGEAAHDGAAQVRLSIVDWEMADLGDAYWDVAAILQAYLADWAASMPAQGYSAELMVQNSMLPLSRIQPAMRMFWTTYAAARNLDRATASWWLERAIGYAALRMIQTGFEHLQFSQQLTPEAQRLVQLSLNMLTHPAEAARTLLGF